MKKGLIYYSYCKNKDRVPDGSLLSHEMTLKLEYFLVRLKATPETLMNLT